MTQRPGHGLACTSLFHAEVDCGVAGVPMDDACASCREAFTPLTDEDVVELMRRYN